MRAALAQNRGDIATLGESSALATELFGQIGDLWGIAIAKQMRAEWLALAGRYEEALVASDESTEAMRHITSTWDLQQQQGLAVNMLVRLGRIDDAIARADQLLAEADESGSSRAAVLATSTRGLLALQLGDVETARAMFDRRDSVASEWPELPAQLEALASLGRGWLAMLDGDHSLAEQELRRAAEAAAASHDHPIMAAIAVGIGRFAIERGFPDDAAQALELAVSLRGAADPDDPLEKSLRNAIEAARPAHVESGRTASGDSEIAELTQILRR
jgi:tetratricopeptide (TPR) repeat protein